MSVATRRAYGRAAQFLAGRGTRRETQRRQGDQSHI
jgi:hypothetical protein